MCVCGGGGGRKPEVFNRITTRFTCITGGKKNRDECKCKSIVLNKLYF